MSSCPCIVYIATALTLNLTPGSCTMAICMPNDTMIGDAEVGPQRSIKPNLNFQQLLQFLVKPGLISPKSCYGPYCPQKSNAIEDIMHMADTSNCPSPSHQCALFLYLPDRTLQLQINREDPIHDASMCPFFRRLANCVGPRIDTCSRRNNA